jgi:hypothetical protein
LKEKALSLRAAILVLPSQKAKSESPPTARYQPALRHCLRMLSISCWASSLSFLFKLLAKRNRFPGGLVRFGTLFEALEIDLFKDRRSLRRLGLLNGRSKRNLAQ